MRAGEGETCLFVGKTEFGFQDSFHQELEGDPVLNHALLEETLPGVRVRRGAR